MKKHVHKHMELIIAQAQDIQKVEVKEQVQ